MHECRRGELLTQHVRRSNGETPEAIELVAAGRIDVNPLATHFFPLAGLGEAFELVRAYADGGFESYRRSHSNHGLTTALRRAVKRRLQGLVVQFRDQS